MPRIHRGLVDGFVYHVLNRGNGGQEIFHKDQDYKALIGLMKEAKKRYPIKIFAYCLMPNHFHFVLMPTRAEELSKLMQWLMTSHVRRYHRHYESSGHIWQGRYKSFVIQQDEHLLMVLRYVEGNPVRGGLVAKAKDWPWSSHNERVNKEIHFLLDNLFIELPVDWSSYVDRPLTEKELNALHQSVDRQSPFGESMWQVHVSKELGLESTMRPRGRPRKNE